MRPSLLVLLAVCAAPALAQAAGPFADTSHYIQSKKKPGPRPAWRAADPQLASSSLRAVKVPGCGVDNGHALDVLLAALKSGSAPEYAVAVVPGSSEAACHHCAWPQNKRDDKHWVEPNFRSRLRHAYLLLLEGVVHSLFISGGSIDAAHPDYNEAIYGARELISEYGAAFMKARGAALQDRIIVDPFAVHSEVNVRNGDRLTRLLGLDRDLVVTETGSMKRQGWWFLHAGVSFNGVCKKSLGFEVGELEELGGAPVFKNYAPKSVLDHNGVKPAQYLNSAGSHPEVDYIQSIGKAEAVDTVVIAHFNLRSTAELMAGGDAHWDLGQKDPEYGKKSYAPDFAKVDAACKALGAKLK